MIRRLRSRLSYANVMATLAVFAALGGGYALATVSGSGSVRFGAEKGISTSFETVLAVPNAGKLQVQCSKGTNVRFKNTSGVALQATRFDEQSGTFAAAVLQNGESIQTFFRGDPPGVDTVRFDVFHVSNSGKPIVGISATHRYGNISCASRAVAAEAVTNP